MTEPFLSLKDREELRAKMDVDAQRRFASILQTYKSDLTANLRGTFAAADFIQIINRAGLRLSHELRGRDSLSYHDVDSAWARVVTDFFRSHYWGYPLLGSRIPNTEHHFGLPHECLEPQEREEIENKNNLKKAMPYLRQFVIGLIIWKILVIYLAQQGCFDWGILRR